MNKNDSQAIRVLLAEPTRIAITMHQRPDGDALGSALGLRHYLTSLGHQVAVVSPTGFPPNLAWIPGAESVMIGPEQEQAAKGAFMVAEVIFCLDFNDLRRIEPLDEWVRLSDAKRVMIDHHTHPDDFYHLAYWDDEASSTAEMIYRLIGEWDDTPRIQKACATALFTGLVTDTGSFRFPSTTPAVHQMAAALIAAGAPNGLIYDRLFAQDSEKRLHLLGHALSRLRVLHTYHCAYMVLDRHDVARFDIQTGDTEGLVNYGLSIRGINMSAFFIEKEGSVKMSFRSRGRFAVNEFSAAHFNGGGHRNAAGGRSTEPIEAVEKRFLTLLERYKADLSYVYGQE